LISLKDTGYIPGGYKDSIEDSSILSGNMKRSVLKIFDIINPKFLNDILDVRLKYIL